MPITSKKYCELSSRLNILLDENPAEAVKQAQSISLVGSKHEHVNLMNLKASILIDGGALTQQQDAIEEGLTLFRELHKQFPAKTGIIYNLANGLLAKVGHPPRDQDWLDYQERIRRDRTEARQCLWKAAQDSDSALSLRTQAWTNLANQFSSSYRLSEAHDAWLTALKIDPENGVAASSASRNLLWLYQQGGCSEITQIEARMLAKIARQHQDKIIQHAGKQAAEQIATFVNKLEDPPSRSANNDPFIRWVEQERLTLAPVVELVDPSLGKLDWLTLPDVLERIQDTSGMPPPVFAMFNVLKSDFILARDLVWRVINENAWPTTGKFADTLDYATYGPDSSALILAHRTALDLLDKVAVTANHYFQFGLSPNKVYFGKLWRVSSKKETGVQPLIQEVENTIRRGVRALYGLVELADDYDTKEAILYPQKDLRNAGTHRFVVLHDFGDPAQSRQIPEIEHYQRELFIQEVLNAIRLARSAIQMLALSIRQHEKILKQGIAGPVGLMLVPDHDEIRGLGEKYTSLSG